MQDPDGFNPTPTFYVDVKAWRGGETKTVDRTAAAYPINLRDLETGYYKFAAVLDIDTLERINTATAGNFYSRDVKAFVETGKQGETHLYLSRRFPERRFRETETVKQLSYKTVLVSSRLKRDAFIKAVVVLPPGFHQTLPCCIHHSGLRWQSSRCTQSAYRTALWFWYGQRKNLCVLKPGNKQSIRLACLY